MGASAWFENQSPAVQRRLAHGVAAELARRDPTAAPEWARRIDPNGDRGPWPSVLVVIAQSDPIRAIELASGVGPQGAQSETLAAAIGYLAQQDPVLAAAYLDRVPPGQARDGAVQRIAGQMANKDPLEALEWLDGRREAAATQGARTQIAGQWARKDAKAALAYAEELPERDRLPWLHQVLNAVMQEDTNAAIALLGTLHEGPEYEHIVYMIGSELASRGDGALLSVADRQIDPTLRDRLPASGIQGLAAQSIPDAVRMLDRIRDDRQKGAAAQGVVRQWIESDPDGARAWVAALPAGPVRDYGYASLIPRMESPEDMEAAIRRISDPTAREQAVQMAAMSLAEHGNATEARALLARYPLRPEATQMLELRIKEIEAWRTR